MFILTHKSLFPERIVIGDDGSIWLIEDHYYQPFNRIRWHMIRKYTVKLIVYYQIHGH